MVDQKIFKIADQLKNVLNEQMATAQKSLLSLPEGETKSKLKKLLSAAASGKLSQGAAQKELQKIMSNAR